MGLPWTVLVCPVAALSRKVVPAAQVMGHAEHIEVEQIIDRERLSARLAAAGYEVVALDALNDEGPESLAAIARARRTASRSAPI